ncbi:hypothetical protein BJ508DRAFT_322832 [Ascobolus immersus RN42]|uniref:Uncharacterized protein n=1 Tax=Ascobolus immersus RN42 TaxID=1160509 RepID=A0A3N4IGX4_ASCIM|nr:hypothetical protein BJ508DRAFT_322832 [Ascobolus immersus RN42]
MTSISKIDIKLTYLLEWEPTSPRTVVFSNTAASSIKVGDLFFKITDFHGLSSPQFRAYKVHLRANREFVYEDPSCGLNAAKKQIENKEPLSTLDELEELQEDDYSVITVFVRVLQILYPLPTNVVPRDDTVSAMVDRLDKVGVLLCHGPIACGKSSLAKLFYNLIVEEYDNRCVYLQWEKRGSRSRKDLTWDQYLCKDQPDLNPENLMTSPVVFIIDEAHLAYEDECDFWFHVKQQKLSGQRGPKFLLMCSYGTLEEWEPYHRIPLFDYFCADGVSRLSIALTTVELEISCIRMGIAVEPRVVQYLHLLTGGHSGLSMVLLRGLPKTEGRVLTLEEAQEVWDNPQTVLELMQKDPRICQSLPKANFGSIEYQSLIDTIIDAGSFTDAGQTTGGLQEAHRRGYIYADYHEICTGYTQYIFPTEIHRRAADMILRGHSNNNELLAYASPKELCASAIVNELSLMSLRRHDRMLALDDPSLSKYKYGYGEEGFQYSHELYFALFREIRYSSTIKSAFSAFSKCRDEFFIPEMGWKIRVLYHGSSPNSETLDFRIENQKPIKEEEEEEQNSYVVIDFRRSMPKEGHGNPNRIFVIIDEFSTTLDMYDHNLKLLAHKE